MPSEDGVSYLWLAQQFAAGDLAPALASPFPPGFPLLLAPWLVLGVPPERAADVANALCLFLAVPGVARVAACLRPEAALPAAVAFAGNGLLLRVAGEVYSEPPFLCAMAWGTAAGLSRRHWRAGLWAAVAFAIRPDGLVLAVSLALVAPRTAWRALVPAALGVAALAAWRWALGLGFDLLPLLAFHEQRDDLPLRGDWIANLRDVPAAWFEAFWLVGVLAPCVLLPNVQRRGGAGKAPLCWQVLLQLVAMLTFVVRRRFFLSCAVPVAAVAGLVVAGLRPRLRWLALLLIAAPAVVRAFVGGVDADRAVEREVGVLLAGRLQPGERVTGDLPRVVYFAGSPPPPPRHFDAEALVAMAQAPGVRFVVLSVQSQRASSRAAAAGLGPAFVAVALPAAAEARGITVFERR